MYYRILALLTFFVLMAFVPSQAEQSEDIENLEGYDNNLEATNYRVVNVDQETLDKILEEADADEAMDGARARRRGFGRVVRSRSRFKVPKRIARRNRARRRG